MDISKARLANAYAAVAEIGDRSQLQRQLRNSEGLVCPQSSTSGLSKTTASYLYSSVAGTSFSMVFERGKDKYRVRLGSRLGLSPSRTVKKP